MVLEWHINIFIICLSILFILSFEGYSQQITRIQGKIIDANTKEPLPFVNVYFSDNQIGTTTDYSGKYSIESLWASNQLQASFIGYENQIKAVIIGKSQKINFQLESTTTILNEVVVVSKKKRYRNKDNPAVDLIRKVIANKSKNRKEKLDYYEFEKYEKVEFDLNNITKKFSERKVFKDLQFIFNYVDTSALNAKPFLPVFLKESASKVYYRKSPPIQKEFISGTKMIGLHDYIDNEGVSSLVDYLYSEIDIYDNNISLLTNQFVSPLSKISPIIYKFIIIDTVNINGYNCVNLAFQPRNKLDFAFIGNLYITTDGKYSVIKADMAITEDINLNFVNDLKITQEFDYINNESWMLVVNNMVVDYNLRKKGIGIFGKKSVYYRNYLFNIQRQDTIYKGVDKVVQIEGSDDRDDDFWKNNRIAELSEKEESIYSMMDSVQHVPAFKRTMDVVLLLTAGYWNFGNFDIGPVNTFYSFNDVEGFRLRVGGRTSDKFSETFRLKGYLLYGFRDDRLKYSISSTWSLNKKNLLQTPKHSIEFMYQFDTSFPGMELQFINEDNFLLSFKRGVADKIYYNRFFNLEHYLDWTNSFSTTLNFKRNDQEPGGTLYFNYEDYSLDRIISSEIGVKVRYAPNGKFYQGINYKVPIISKYPIFQVSFTQGIKGMLNADFSYSKLKFNVFKRFYLSPIGFTNFELEVGKVYGEGTPFPLLFTHRANQTYSYQIRSYNLMNFLEFVSDQYVAIYLEHHFYGFFFNKIPFLKRLKLREIISFKGIYGGVSDKNNPEITRGLMLFPTDVNGNTTTFTLDDKPYMEISVGIGNIFKFFRVDLVKRLTYLDNPNVQEYGIRARFKFDF